MLKYAELAQEFDEPYVTEDLSYFPASNASFYVNPNGTDVQKSASDTSNVNPFPMGTCYGLPLEEATVDQMQEWMTCGNLTSRQLVTCYISRILQVNEYVK